MKKEVKNIFNQSYEQHQSDVDPANIWEAIERKNNEKKPKGIFWWMFGASALVLALIAYQFLGTGNIEQSIVSEAAVEKDQKSSSLSANSTSKSNVKNTPATNNTLITDKNNIQKNTEINNSQPSTGAQELSASSASTRNIKNTQQPAKELLKSKSKITSAIPVETVNTTNNNIRNSTNYTEKNKLANQNNNSINNTELQMVEVEKSLEGIQETTQNSKPTKALGASHVIMESIGRLENDLEAFTVSMEIVPCILSISDVTSSAALKTAGESEDSEKIKKQAAKFSLVALGTAGLFNDQFVDGDKDYLAFRSDTEDPLESFGTQIGLNYQWKNFGIESGVNYLRVNRVMEWTSSYFGNSEGDIIFEHDPSRFDPSFFSATADSMGVYFYKKSFRKYNETHTVSIPVTLNYSYSLKSFDLGVFAGAAFHIVQKNNVDVLDESGALIDQRQLSSDIKRRPDLMAGVFVDYKLNENIYLTGRMGYRHRKTTEASLVRKTGMYNLGLGLKYHLSR